MLVTLNRVLEYAEGNNQANGAFNACNYEGIQAIIRAAEELNQPVILQYADAHEGYITLDEIGPIMVMMGEKAKVPVCVHLDHGSKLSEIKKALEMGFTSVMYDGSHLDFDKNVANTRIAVEIADEYGASVEPEIGAMGGEGKTCEDKYTNPDEAKEFVELTGVDALACSFGTIHGLYFAEPKLDFDIISEVREKANIPVVMHGGSGVSAEDFAKSIEAGVRKVNYFTYMDKAAGAVLSAYVDEVKAAGTPVFFAEPARRARQAMKENVIEAMK